MPIKSFFKNIFGSSENKAQTFVGTGIVKTSKIVTSNLFKNLSEAFKGEIQQDKKKLFAKNSGEEHPYDYALLEAAYLQTPLIYGAINKIVDFTVSKSFHVSSDDELVEDTLKQFMKYQNFDVLLRQIVRDMLIYGNSFVELNFNGETIEGLYVRTPKFMYVKRDQFGNIKGYNQVIDALRQSVEFDVKEKLPKSLAGKYTRKVYQGKIKPDKTLSDLEIEELVNLISKII